jgi:putative glutamine amidotransferase
MPTLQKFHSNKKPIILITTSNAKDSRLGDVMGDTDVIYSDKATTLAIIRAGAIPLCMPTCRPYELDDLEMYMDLVDGIVLSGAISNVSPSLYAEVPVDAADTGVDELRDRTDMELVKRAYERKMPILGICKGMQLMNVALGGTLHQEILPQDGISVSHNISGKRTQVTHEANMVSGSLLQSIFKRPKVGLNGGHQQAVNRLSGRLQASLIAEDGIVEAYEGKDHPFLLGIQFHAELLELSEPHLAIFKRFADATRSYRLQAHKES